MPRILFVEDNDDYRQTLSNMLENADYEVDAVPDALQAIQLFALNDYQLIISDLKMEAVDGLVFLRHIKNEAADVKTMLLTAEPSMDTELEALDILVDKYLTKDTRVDVILRYIEVLLDSKTQQQTLKNKVYIVKSEGIVVDVDAFKVTKNNVKIDLTYKEFMILCLLLSRRGRAISRNEFFEKLWDTEYEVTSTRVIDMHIKSIRRKLQTQSILSVRGYGYKWDD